MYFFKKICGKSGNDDGNSVQTTRVLHIMLYFSTILIGVSLYVWSSTFYNTEPAKTKSGPPQVPLSVNFYYYSQGNRRLGKNSTEINEVSPVEENSKGNVSSTAYQMRYKGTKYLGVRCISKSLEGVCYTRRECLETGGTPGIYCIDPSFVCCVYQHSCGDATRQRVSYFRSPDFPNRSIGTLACDYDIAIQMDVCAVRIEFEKTELSRKLGGVCDIDQIFILNSVDGPTTGQCGPLSGYSTTVAVAPGQKKPIKLAVLIQNEGYYRWNIKVIQLKCTELNNFKGPTMCGRKSWDLTSSTEHHPNIFHLWHDVKWRRYTRQHRSGIWWSFPEPVFNTYYYGAMKKHMLLQDSHPVYYTRSWEEDDLAEDRIVGGTDAELNEFPWQVAIFLEDLFFCGGALISDRFVLTAAHCIMTRDSPIEQLVLRLGDYDLATENETTHVMRGVQMVLYHSHFHPFLLSNDIALLLLDKPVAFSHRIRPVCLPESGESYTGRKAIVVGWGITSFPMGEPSPVLQKLEVETISNFQCSRIIEEPVGLGMICAAPASLQGTCFGDSGGPLTTVDNNDRDILIGVVSFGVTGCAVIPAFPDLYTRVSEYLKWIDVNGIV